MIYIPDLQNSDLSDDLLFFKAKITKQWWVSKANYVKWPESTPFIAMLINVSIAMLLRSNTIKYRSNYWRRYTITIGYS